MRAGEEGDWANITAPVLLIIHRDGGEFLPVHLYLTATDGPAVWVESKDHLRGHNPGTFRWSNYWPPLGYYDLLSSREKLVR